MATLVCYIVTMIVNETNGVNNLAILIYDEDKRLRRATSNIIMQLYKKNNDYVDIYSFDNPENAMKCVSDGSVEIVFISLDDKFGRGFYLAKKLKKYDSEINLITMAQELKYEPELIKLRISGYIVGDRTEEKILNEINNIYD